MEDAEVEEVNEGFYKDNVNAMDSPKAMREFSPIYHFPGSFIPTAAAW